MPGRRTASSVRMKCIGKPNDEAWLSLRPNAFFDKPLEVGGVYGPAYLPFVPYEDVY